MIKQVRKFFADAILELKRVKVPSRERTLRLTGVILVVCLIIGAYIGALDYAFTKIITVLL